MSGRTTTNYREPDTGMALGGIELNVLHPELRSRPQVRSVRGSTYPLKEASNNPPAQQELERYETKQKPKFACTLNRTNTSAKGDSRQAYPDLGSKQKRDLFKNPVYYNPAPGLPSRPDIQRDFERDAMQHGGRYSIYTLQRIRLYGAKGVGLFALRNGQDASKSPPKPQSVLPHHPACDRMWIAILRSNTRLGRGMDGFGFLRKE